MLQNLSFYRMPRHSIDWLKFQAFYSMPGKVCIECPNVWMVHLSPTRYWWALKPWSSERRVLVYNHIYQHSVVQVPRLGHPAMSYHTTETFVVPLQLLEAQTFKTSTLPNAFQGENTTTSQCHHQGYLGPWCQCKLHLHFGDLADIYGQYPAPGILVLFQD